MSGLTASYSGRFDGFGTLLMPLMRQFWVIVLVVTVGTLATLAYGRMELPLYEASAVVQVQAGVDLADTRERLLRRDNLIAMAVRHRLSTAQTGVARDRAAVLLRRAIAVHDLTADAGQTLGFAPQVAGLVVSVLLPDAEVSARVANDLAQQILDLGHAGKLDAHHHGLEFYRADEVRIWQEMSAMRAEGEQAARLGTVAAMDAAIGLRRQVMLMQDQYDVVRRHLAEGEVAARLASQAWAGQFSLLQRATSTEAVSVVRNWMLVGVAGSLLLAVTLVFVLERRYPALQRGPWQDLAALRARVYRLFDDPARPILGVPRYVVISALIVTWLYLIAGTIR